MISVVKIFAVACLSTTVAISVAGRAAGRPDAATAGNTRYLFANPCARSLASADAAGTRPDRRDGARFEWKVVGE